MADDINPILAQWPFDPESVNVRVIEGQDGKEKIQMRLDLGLLQMDRDARPDGQRPHGFDSWLDYHRHRQRMIDADTPGAFNLDEEECTELMREGLQYYHRYISFLHLKRFDLCARDTQRNLGLFAFVRRYAEQSRAWQFDQYRPYVVKIHTRAVAQPLLDRGKANAAVRSIDSGINAVWEFLDDWNRLDESESCEELKELVDWRESLIEQHDLADLTDPPEPTPMLRKRLNEAVRSEAYEEAARLRDEIERRASEEQQG